MKTSVPKVFAGGDCVTGPAMLFLLCRVWRKYKAARPEFAPEGIRDVDTVLTTGEMIEMLKLARIDTGAVEFAEFD